ncbi:hypothetical protein FUT28_02315 [Enterococcus durans]|uniref:hypothetical protein n=1 Tax=Enterococcus durans TaxID=53345 RepID=UPI0011BF0AD3|nr:hypothetical protein [Enterococcus durans]QED60128.1 hypothetical protein FS851_09810 [Enterococcus durans]QED61424.1 hypothetical protein FUT28_02315 [Enterococcus durans]
MGDAEKKQLEIEKKQFSLKIMYFNRYLIIRYLTAGFFFMNLYWLIILLVSKSIFLIVLIGLIGLTLPAVGEQIRLYRQHQNTVPRTKRYFKWQGIMNGILCGLLFTPFYTSMFPFMVDNLYGKLGMIVFLGSGCLICALCHKRLESIQVNKDRQYQRIKTFEQAAYLGKESN